MRSCSFQAQPLPHAEVDLSSLLRWLVRLLRARARSSTDGGEKKGLSRPACASKGHLSSSALLFLTAAPLPGRLSPPGTVQSTRQVQCINSTCVARLRARDGCRNLGLVSPRLEKRGRARKKSSAGLAKRMRMCGEVLSLALSRSVCLIVRAWCGVCVGAGAWRSDEAVNRSRRRRASAAARRQPGEQLENANRPLQSRGGR